MTTPTNDLISPWVPIQDAKQLKIIGKLLEELGELTSATARCMIQGVKESEPITGKPNIDWLTEEVADVYACLVMLRDMYSLDAVVIQDRAAKKKAKLDVWAAML